MKDLLEKISSYNLFTHLLPGVLFVVILKELTEFNLVFEPVFLGLFLYYFIGIVINRIGSLAVEPFLKKCKFLEFIEYSKFVKASKLDTKIEILSETNNMCRSLIALCLTLLIAIGYEWLLLKVAFIDKYNAIIILIALLAIFILAYCKQTKYVVKRCKVNLDEE